MKFINIGFGNMVSAGRIVAIASPDSAPVKRLVQELVISVRYVMIQRVNGKLLRTVLINK